MDKQSQIVKALHSALDELEVLAIEGELLDVEIVDGLMEKIKKLKGIIQHRDKKSNI